MSSRKVRYNFYVNFSLGKMFPPPLASFECFCLPLIFCDITLNVINVAASLFAFSLFIFGIYLALSSVCFLNL